MIEPQRQNRALSALHRVLIEARHMALTGSPAADLASVLDWAELLPTLIAAPADKTKDFRVAIAAIADRFPGFRAALNVFDDPEPPPIAERRRAVAAAALASAPR